MSERVYRWLLSLYPAGFRERYGEEMTRVFRDRLQNESAARVWLDVLRDAAVSIPREHTRAPMKHSIYPPSAAPLQAQTTPLMLWIGSASVLSGAVTWGIFKGEWLWAAIALLVFLRTGWTAHRHIQSRKRWYAEVNSDSVSMSFGEAPLTLARSEVTGVVSYPGIGLRIQTADPSRDLWIPKIVRDYTSIRDRVTQWAPVTTGRLFVRGTTWQYVVWYLYASLISLTSTAGFAIAAAVLGAMALYALWRRDFPLHKKLLYLGPLAVVAARWLW